MPLTPPEEWFPVGVDDLEPVAWNALRHEGNACVIAGPGAGKTEFLAQKACYLLETGICPYPERILAISFKADAAVNLRRRVEKRVPDQSHRFQSLTFDAFTKGLVDRFKAALPDHWRPRSTYDLDVTVGNSREVSYYLDDLARRAGKFASGVAAISRRSFLSEALGSFRLPAEPADPRTAVDFAVYSWWEDLYVNSSTQAVEFTMLNRLAELIVRSNPQIRRALRLTYPIVFLDEFQDTTFAQYDFLKSVFGDRRITVTAVGDGKQSIMRWAGAMQSGFDELKKDFRAAEFPLGMNYRSSDALIEVQHVVALALDPAAARPKSGNDAEIDEDACQIWSFESLEEEAEKIADWIAADIITSGRQPSDYALLARQKTDDFEPRLSAALGRHGIALRNDSLRVDRTTLQDLLVDEMTVLFMGLVRLAATRRNPTTWGATCSTMTAVRGVDVGDAIAARRVADDVSILVHDLRAWLHGNPPTPGSADALVDELLARVGRDALKRTFLSYRTADAFVIAESALRSRLTEVANASSTWLEACDKFQGVDAVPLMTVHKSKGLEYHTVIFLGIDDQQWWAHQPGQFDGLATFFVGLSRAEQRAMFTYCAQRGNRNKVDELYRLLYDAGVVETSW